MKSQTLTANNLHTICWQDDTIVDWVAGGTQYFLNGNIKHVGKYHFDFSFDSSINSQNGQYSFIYQRLGTKGLLLKNGEESREINRSYYCANSYEYPAAFVTVADKTYLIHCPKAYDRLDFEDVETGEIITNTCDRKSNDIFHSRLEVSPDNTFLLSKGWLWHPVEYVVSFDIKACIDDPTLLDKQNHPDLSVEICTASFIDDNKVLVGSSDEVFNENELLQFPCKSLSVWDLTTNKFSKPVAVKEKFGNLFAISDHEAWDLFGFPKIINLQTGDVVDQNTKIYTGEQNSSIIITNDNNPVMVFNRSTKQIAIKRNLQIEVLTPDRIEF